MKTLHEADGITVIQHDSREGWPIDLPKPGCVIFDPPWDDDSAIDCPLPKAPSTLVFTDPRRMGQAIDRFGSPAWCFTWNTMNKWQTGPRRPVQQTKQCLWYGDLDSYRRDGLLWGDPPDDRHYPGTTFDAADGRRLTDLWSESLRWLHHPDAGVDSGGRSAVQRDRKGDEVLRHAKPLGWVRCLIANCSEGPVFDPFCGSGTALRAALDLGRPAVGIDISEEACRFTIDQLAQTTLPVGGVA